MVYKVEDATPIRLAFWGSVGPRDLKPTAIHAGADGHAMCRRSGSNIAYSIQ
jgi:hypothetical protein